MQYRQVWYVLATFGKSINSATSLQYLSDYVLRKIWKCSFLKQYSSQITVWCSTCDHFHRASRANNRLQCQTTIGLTFLLEGDSSRGRACEACDRHSELPSGSLSLVDSPWLPSPSEFNRSRVPVTVEDERSSSRDGFFRNRTKNILVSTSKKYW